MLELKGKLELSAAAGIIGSTSAATEVVDALTGLGYTAAEIQAALSGIPKDEPLSTEEMVLLALKNLGR